jgi:hypothetical protein
VLRYVCQRVEIIKETACDNRQQNDIISRKIGISRKCSMSTQRGEIHCAQYQLVMCESNCI